MRNSGPIPRKIILFLISRCTGEKILIKVQDQTLDTGDLQGQCYLLCHHAALLDFGTASTKRVCIFIHLCLSPICCIHFRLVMLLGNKHRFKLLKRWSYESDECKSGLAEGVEFKGLTYAKSRGQGLALLSSRLCIKFNTIARIRIICARLGLVHRQLHQTFLLPVLHLYKTDASRKNALFFAYALTQCCNSYRSNLTKTWHLFIGNMDFLLLRVLSIIFAV